MTKTIQNLEIADGVLYVVSDPRYDDPAFKEACLRIVEFPAEKLVVDLTAVKFISSREVGTLVGAAKRAREKGKALVLRVSIPVRGILKILRLDTFLNLE
ncbi:MAG: STAS domain-containing protein [Planctomycetota bacterium]|nr:STAS domain-containing protein [Planctomycetota bacterium]